MTGYNPKDAEGFINLFALRSRCRSRPQRSDDGRSGSAQRCGAGASNAPPDASFYEFERSWQFDRRLLPQELALDRAWARAIAAAGILTREECAADRRRAR